MARLPRDVTTAVTWYMEENGISQRTLADNMDVTPGRVSQILSGDENLTLRTLAAVCVGLGAHFEVDLVSNNQERQVPHSPDSAAGVEDVKAAAAEAADQLVAYESALDELRARTTGLQAPVPGLRAPVAAGRRRSYR